MQIVIELSDLDYKWITLRKGDETLYPLTLTVYEAIKNGTPLKTGHWLYIDERKAKCSQCGYIKITGGADKTGHCNIHYGVYKYCTNCGAKMEEQDADSN